MMLVAMMMLALAAPNPHALDAPRKAYSACIKAFETKSLARQDGCRGLCSRAQGRLHRRGRGAGQGADRL